MPITDLLPQERFRDWSVLAPYSLSFFEDTIILTWEFEYDPCDPMGGCNAFQPLGVVISASCVDCESSYVGESPYLMFNVATYRHTKNKRWVLRNTANSFLRNFDDRIRQEDLCEPSGDPCAIPVTGGELTLVEFEQQVDQWLFQSQVVNGSKSDFILFDPEWQSCDPVCPDGQAPLPDGECVSPSDFPEPVDQDLYNEIVLTMGGWSDAPPQLYYVCSDGTCSSTTLFTPGCYTSLAECQANTNPAEFTGGQCAQPYLVVARVVYCNNAWGEDYTQEWEISNGWGIAGPIRGLVLGPRTPTFNGYFDEVLSIVHGNPSQTTYVTAFTGRYDWPNSGVKSYRIVSVTPTWYADTCGDPPGQCGQPPPSPSEDCYWWIRVRLQPRLFEGIVPSFYREYQIPGPTPEQGGSPIAVFNPEEFWYNFVWENGYTSPPMGLTLSTHRYYVPVTEDSRYVCRPS